MADMISPATGQKFDSKESLERIQEILRSLEYQHESQTMGENGPIHDRLIQLRTAHQTIIKGLLYALSEFDENENIRFSEGNALLRSWEALEETIEELEKEHSKIWNLAFHGTEELELSRANQS